MESPKGIGGFDLLPPEAVKIICESLPRNDQIRIVPNVCRLWRSLCDLEARKSYQELAKEVLKNQIIYFENPQYSDREVEIIIELARKNNLISIIKQQVGFCEIGGYGSFSTYARIRQELSVREGNHGLECSSKQYSGFSPYMKIYWNPKKLQLGKNEKIGNWHTSFTIEIEVEKFIFIRENVFKSFAVKANRSFVCEKKGRFYWSSWEQIKLEKIEPLRMDKLIEYAFNVELKMYVAYFTNMNLLTISESEIASLKDGTVLKYSCDGNGCIIEDQDEKTVVKNYLNIWIKVVAEDLSVLAWDSSDYNDFNEMHCNIAKVLRWSIFSSTCESLARLLGLSIVKL